MAVHRIRKGLDLPLAGDPEQKIHDGPEIFRVAVMGDDTPGVRARLHVAEGDTVRRGQLLMEDRSRPGVRYASPGAGRVTAIFRGHRRMLRSVVIQLSESERAGAPGEGELERFASWREGEPEDYDAAGVRELMVESGLWRALRARPYGKVPLPDAYEKVDEKPHALFVTAIDTNPHAPDPVVVVEDALEDFQRGLRLLATLHGAEPIVCVADRSGVAPGLEASVRVERFKGPHPAGNPGLHIHLLAPVSRHRSAWHIGYQDVIALGRLAATGRLPVERVVSLGGPPVRRPRLLRTRLGACLEELTAGEIREDGRDVRLLSGSVLSGKKAVGPEFGFLGRYHVQVAALAEGNQRRFFGWIAPGANQFSVLPIFVSKLLFGKKFDMTTDTNGSHRPMISLGTYERVMPMDVVATYLLRALIVGDVEQAEQLGALELEEEDLSLCTFVCPGKTEFGPYLRKNLERIEKEG